MQMVNMPGLMDGNIGEVPQHSNSHRKARHGCKDQGRHFVSMVRPLQVGRLRAGNKRHFFQECIKSIFPRQRQIGSISALRRKPGKTPGPAPCTGLSPAHTALRRTAGKQHRHERHLPVQPFPGMHTCESPLTLRGTRIHTRPVRTTGTNRRPRVNPSTQPAHAEQNSEAPNKESNSL
jgi:hypothetical protein